MTFFGFKLLSYDTSLWEVCLATLPFPHKILEIEVEAFALGSLGIFSFHCVSNSFIYLFSHHLLLGTWYRLVESIMDNFILQPTSTFSVVKLGSCSWYPEGREQRCIYVLQCMDGFLKQIFIWVNMSMTCHPYQDLDIRYLCIVPIMPFFYFHFTHFHLFWYFQFY